MNHCMIIGCMMLTGLGSATTLAQNTLGELLDAGGRKLSKDEVKVALSGARVTGLNLAGGTVDYDFKADGSYSGSGQNPNSRPWGLIGTWKVEDSGQLCTEYRLTGWVVNNTYCYFLFVSSDQQYMSESDSDRNAPVLKRTIKK